MKDISIIYYTYIKISIIYFIYNSINLYIVMYYFNFYKKEDNNHYPIKSSDYYNNSLVFGIIGHSEKI
jgi:hypothetical protein